MTKFLSPTPKSQTGAPNLPSCRPTRTKEKINDDKGNDKGKEQTVQMPVLIAEPQI